MMLRLIALFVFLVVAGFVYEEYTGKSIGVKALVRSIGSFATGEYGVSTGGASSAVDGVRGVGNSVGRIFGN